MARPGLCQCQVVNLNYQVFTGQLLICQSYIVTLDCSLLTSDFGPVTFNFSLQYQIYQEMTVICVDNLLVTVVTLSLLRKPECLLSTEAFSIK